MIQIRTCVEILCDNDCDGRGWGDGPLHFDTVEEATEYARTLEFVIIGGTTLCASCAADRDCEVTGHQYDDWQDDEMYGVAFKRRWCGHCGATDYNVPIAELGVLLRAARIVDGHDS